MTFDDYEIRVRRLASTKQANPLSKCLFVATYFKNRGHGKGRPLKLRREERRTQQQHRQRSRSSTLPTSSSRRNFAEVSRDWLQLAKTPRSRYVPVGGDFVVLGVFWRTVKSISCVFSVSLDVPDSSASTIGKGSETNVLQHGGIDRTSAEYRARGTRASLVPPV